MIQNSNIYDVVVIGSGPAGLTAGIYVGRSKYRVCILGGNIPLGQLMNTTEVENYPGFPDGISGPKLMSNMKEQYERLGTEFRTLQVEKVIYDSGSFILDTNADQYKCNALIIASGSEPKWLNIPSEYKFKGKGVSTCATCDGFFYKNKNVAVIGGGDTAMEETIYLSGITKKVYLIHRRDEFRASQMMQDKLESKKASEKNIEIILNHIVDEFIEQENKLTSIRLKDTTDDTSQTISVDGVFVAIGHTPQSHCIKHMVDLDKNGYVLSTKIKGLFVCGDVADHKYRQAITAAGKGCEAALDAIRFLDERA